MRRLTQTDTRACETLLCTKSGATFVVCKRRDGICSRTPGSAGSNRTQTASQSSPSHVRQGWSCTTRGKAQVPIPGKRCRLRRLTFSTYTLIRLRLSTKTMSTSQRASSTAPNFQPILDKALKEYKKKTGKDLTTHPLADEIKDCSSPDAILTVLQGKANDLNRSQSSDERLTKWLTPTVNVLNALSSTIGQGVGTVSPNMLRHHICPDNGIQIFPPTQIIFAGINVLLVVSFLAQFHRVGRYNTLSLRRLGTRLRAAMRSSNSSTKSKTSLYVSRPIQKSRQLQR